jgi:hypothetical protein
MSIYTNIDVFVKDEVSSVGLSKGLVGS